MVEILLEANADVNIKTNVRVAVHSYIYTGVYPIGSVYMYLESQVMHCCVSMQQNHWTALHSASSKGHAEVVGVLLAAKATVNTQDKVSSTLYALSSYMTCSNGVVCSMVTNVRIDWTVSSLVSQFPWSPESCGTVDQS